MNAEKNQKLGAMQVSCVQMHWARNLEHNLEQTRRFIAQAAAEGSRVVLFPEASLTGYYFPYAVKLSRQAVLDALTEAARAAAEHSIWTIVGSIRAWKGRFLNLAHVIDPTGRVTYEYAKVQMAGEEERRYCIPGEKVALFRIDNVDCTLSICRDGRHPELFRIPAMLGARIFFQPSCSSESLEAVTWKRVSGRAQQAAGPKAYIHHLAANTVGQSPDGAESSSGQSFIRDATGLPLAEAGYYEECLLTAVLDLDKATGFYARQSAQGPQYLRPYWEQMQQEVLRHADDPPESE